MKIGYARVSTKDQNLELQLDALKKAGCGTVFEEKVGATSSERPELEKLMVHIRQGDVVVVWKLDRLGRSLRDLLSMVSGFEKKGVGFTSLQDHIDTTTPQGRLVFNIFASLAEFERELIKERTLAGIEAAKARGRVGGRRHGLSAASRKNASDARTMYLDNDPRSKLSITEICKHLKISRATFYSYLDYLNVDRPKRPFKREGKK